MFTGWVYPSSGLLGCLMHAGWQSCSALCTIFRLKLHHKACHASADTPSCVQPSSISGSGITTTWLSGSTVTASRLPGIPSSPVAPSHWACLQPTASTWPDRCAWRLRRSVAASLAFMAPNAQV